MTRASHTPERILYQFPISHYCEKTRWNLDAKGLPYVTRNVLPGVSIFVARRHGAPGTMPLLVDRGVALGDSTDIALHLERAYPEPALLPSDPTLRTRALELEAYFDKEVGPAVRRWFYGRMLGAGGAIGRVFFGHYPPMARAFGRAAAPLFERVLNYRYRLDAENVARARARIEAALDRLEHEIGGDPTRHLVGDRMTLADITAASLFGPLVAAPECATSVLLNANMSSELLEARDTIRRRPAGQWLLARYAHDRGRTAAA